MKKKDILFLCQYFYPDQNSSATIPFDTAVALQKAGFTVGALVGYPGEYSQANGIPERETVEGVEIRRLHYSQRSRVGKLGRLWNFFSFTANALAHLHVLRGYRSVIVYSNPPILPLVSMLAKQLFGTKLVFVSFDVYPEIAQVTGAVSGQGIISRLMKWINRRLYQHADAVVSLTDEMRDYLLQNRPELTPDRIMTISNWAHETTTPVSEAAYRRFGFESGQFIVSYFGNLGTCQDVEALMRAAEQLRDHSHIRFLIAGHGNKLPLVRERIARFGLDHVVVPGFLEGDAFRDAVAVSSCCVVSLEKGLNGLCAPSKYYSYLQGGSAILAVVEPDNYIATELRKEQIGFSSAPGDGTALAENILALELDRDRCKIMGKRAAELYQRAYSAEKGQQKYVSLFRETLGNEE